LRSRCQRPSGQTHQPTKHTSINQSIHQPTSLGGFLAARYAELHPGRVEKLVLLCPGFDRCSRWEALFGPAVMREWEAAGWRGFEVKKGDGL